MPPNVEAVGVQPAPVAGRKKPLEMVQLLVDRGVTAVPEKFIQPVHERPARLTDPGYVSGGRDLQVPVIDMAGVEGERRGQIMAEVSRACEEWGFFQVCTCILPNSYTRRQKNAVIFFGQFMYFCFGDEKLLSILEDDPFSRVLEYLVEFTSR